MNFLNLDIGVPVESFKQPVRDCLSGEKDFQEITVDAVNRRGRQIQCKVTCAPLVSKSDGIRGAMLLVEHEDAHERT